MGIIREKDVEQVLKNLNTIREERASLPIWTRESVQKARALDIPWDTIAEALGVTTRRARQIADAPDPGSK